MIPINFYPTPQHALFFAVCAASRPQIGKPLMSKNGLIDSSINRLSHPGPGHLFALIIASTQKFMDI